MSKDNVTRRISIYINDKEVENSLKGVDGAVNQVRNSLRKLVEGTEDYDKKKQELSDKLVQLKQRQSDYRDELGLTNTALSKTGFSVKNLTTSLLASFSIGTAISAFFGAVRSGIKTINDFEQAVADLSAITGATGKDLKYLKEEAVSLGETTKGGAIAVVEAYKLIASAKPELLENVESLNKVTAATVLLAKASGLEMPEAATKLTDAMNQFNAPADQAAKYVDVLAAGAKYGAAEIPQLTDAIIQFGATAKATNVDIKESAALVELLAEKGIKGAEAGTQIRNMLLKVMSGGGTAEARAELGKYGVSIDMLKDKSIPFVKKLEALKPLLTDVGSITKVFGAENSTAAISLIENTKRLGELNVKLGETGVAEEQAAIKMDTVKNKTELLKAKYDSLILSVNNGRGVVSSFFKFFIDGATEGLNQLIRLNSSWDELNRKSAKRGVKDATDFFPKLMNNLKDLGYTPKGTAKSVKSVAANHFKEEDEKLKKVNQNIRLAVKNPFKSARQTGKSLDDLKEEKEQIMYDRSYQAALIKEANKVLTPPKAVKAVVPTDNELPKNNVANAGSGGSGGTTKQKTKEELAAKKKQEQEKADKEEDDRLIGLAKAHADLAKAQLEEFVANNRSKLDNNKKFTDDLLAQENARLLAISDKTQDTLASDRLTKVAELDAKKTSDQEYADAKLAIDTEYNAKLIELEASTQEQIAANKTEFKEQQTQDKAEKLLIDNDLELAGAASKEQEETIIQQQSYKKQLDGYNDLYNKKKITKEELTKFEKSAEAKQDEIQRVKELNKLNNTLGGLNSVAGALGEMFGQSKELAIVQAGINGAMAVTSILAQYPKYDGGFAMWASIAAAGITTIAQVAKITSAKPPPAPKFFHGGHTGNVARLGHDEFGAVTGYVHDQEYVVPKIMTQDPQFADTIGWLEANRQQKMKGYVDGGATSALPLSGSSSPIVDVNLQLAGAVNMLVSVLAGGITAKLNMGYKEVREINEMNNEIKASESNGIIG